MRVATPRGAVTAVLHGDGDVLVVLGPGAGAPYDSGFMRAASDHLEAAGLAVGRFNFPYAESGRKAPDPAPVLEATYAAVAGTLRRRRRWRAVVLGGKSLGGRIASQVVAAGEPADALLFLGYPLHPPGRPDRLRTAHLARVRVPMLFVQGSRDPFCPLDTLERVRADLTAATEVVVVDDGDHSFRLRRNSGRSDEEALAQACGAAAAWVWRTVAGRGDPSGER